MVSNASEDFPEPDGPVTTTNARRGISRSRFFRLCWRAPRTTILSFIIPKMYRMPSPWKIPHPLGPAVGDPAGCSYLAGHDDRGADLHPRHAGHPPRAPPARPR